MMMVPERAPGPGFAATEYFTRPLPLPEAPLVMVMKLSRLTACHEQFPPAVTLTDPSPIPGPNELVAGFIEVIQDDPA